MISSRLVRRVVASVVLIASLAGATSASAQTSAKRATPKPAAAASPSPSVAPYVLPDTVAMVNGEPIKKEALEKVAQAVIGSRGKSLQDLPPAEKRDAYASLLSTMIVDKIVSKETAGESVSDLDVEKGYNDLIKQYANPKAFDDQVKKAGETPEKIKANIRSQLAQQQWLEKQIAADTKVTPQEVEKFYKESSPAQFDEPEMVHARHILVAVRKDAPPEDALKAENRAKELLEQVKKIGGRDAFAEVARKQSDDSTARDTPAKDGAPAQPGNGGDLGWFTKDRIMPEFGDVAFRLQPGEMGGPVRTQFGYHLVQVLDHKPAHTATLDEARDQITAYLQSEKRQAAISRAVADLRAKAKVQTFLP